MNANEEIDETEFYHQDFTTASDWELFISNIEEIVNLWRVDEFREEESPSSDHIWTIKTEKLSFAGTEFILSYYEKQKGLRERQRKTSLKSENDNTIDLDFDFQFYDRNATHEHSFLNQWYGIEEFFVIETKRHNELDSESKIKVVLSSLYIAVSNMNCEIPFFVRIRERWQNLYLGVQENSHFRTSFEMVHLQRGPQHSQHLNGLLSLFSSKIMSPVSLDHIISSVQFTYNLNDFGKCSWSQDVFRMENEVLDIPSLYYIPFGIAVDPINLLQLKATWFNIPSYKVNDSQAYSDFHATRAHQWSVLVKFCEGPICLLSDCLAEYIQLSGSKLTAHEILGELNPLEALVESKVSNIPSILGRAARNSLTSSHKDSSVLPDEILVPLLYHLFPDAEQTKTCNPYNLDDELSEIDKECKGFKTCPPNSLLWRLTIISASLQYSVGGLRSFAKLWYEFIQEMRYRWDKNIIIPGLVREFPDLRTCLLNQKLQMLNICIERKMKREENLKEPNFDSAEGSSSEDEEFFDCADKPEEDFRNIQPVGRLGKFQNLKLVETGELMFIPVTQEPVPKTEDQLDEDADVLLKLGSDAQGSELRAKMMSASLLSDMESFKAANPGAVLEDFVRWYSPRDWNETEEFDQWGQKRGVLSTRMMIEDNIWAQTWKTAKPIAANKQKLLFVDAKEAEKVLHFLESRTLSQVIELLLPILLQVAIYRFSEELVPLDVELSNGAKRLQILMKSFERISRDARINMRRIEALVQDLAQLEFDISAINSIHYKLNPSGNTVEGLKETVKDVFNGKEMKVDKSSETGNQISAMFAEAQRNANLIKEENSEEGKVSQGNLAFSSPNEREFVMRVEAVKPAVYSSKCPQYLRAILSKNEFRLAGAFSEDTTFF